MDSDTSKQFDIDIVLSQYNEMDSDMRKIWHAFCDMHADVDSTSIMIHISSMICHIMLEHLHIHLRSETSQSTAMLSNYEEEGVYYRFGGAALSGMLKTRYKMIRKCKEENISTIS